MRFTMRGLVSHFKKNELGYTYISSEKQISLDKLENSVYVEIKFNDGNETLTLNFTYHITSDREYAFYRFKLQYGSMMKTYRLYKQPEYVKQLEELEWYLRIYLNKCSLKEGK